MKKTLTALLLVMVLAIALAVPAMAETTVSVSYSESSSWSEVVEQITDAGSQYIKLEANVTEEVIISSNLYVDLNGHDMTNVTISGGNLYAFDSTTGDYTCTVDDPKTDESERDYGQITVVSGAPARNFVLPTKNWTGSRHRYITVDEGNGVYSAHRIYLGMVSAVLSPGITAVHYKVELLCDQVVADHLYTADGLVGYGVQFTGDETVNVCVPEGDAPIAYDAALADAVKWNHRVVKLTNNGGYDEQTALVAPKVKAYLLLDDGTAITSSAMSKNFKTIVEAAQVQVPELTDIQNSALTGMYERNTALMADWAVPIHCVCGGDLYGTVREVADHIGDCDGSSEIVFAPWTDTDALPTSAGNYYLSDNVVLPSATCWVFNDNTASGEFNLDLNGMAVVAASNERAIVFNNNLAANITVNITDSSKDHNGVIARSSNNSTNQGALIWMRSRAEVVGTLNIYRAIMNASEISTSHYGAGAAVENNNTLNMYGVTLMGGTSTTSSGSAIYMDGTSAVKAEGCTISGVSVANGDGMGGTVFVQSGSLTLKDTTITSSANSKRGGAVYLNSKTAAAEMTGGSLVAQNGNICGATLYMNNGAKFTLNSGTVTAENVSTNYGTTVALEDVNGSGTAFTMHGGEIIGGTAGGSVGRGGAVIVISATCAFDMKGGKISGGTAAKNGGGVSVEAGTFRLSGDAQITGNKVAEAANDVYLASGATITVGADWQANDGETMNIVMADAVGDGTVLFAKGADLTDEQWGNCVSAIRTNFLANKITVNGLTANEIVTGDQVILYGEDSVKLYTPTADQKIHCICGAQKNGTGDYDSHLGSCTGIDLIWDKWAKTNALPTEGNYYLGDNVSTGQWGLHGNTKYTDSSIASATVNLDLNGKNITVTSTESSQNRALYWHNKLTAKVTLNITDANADNKGSIAASGTFADWGALIYMRNPDSGYQGGELNIYRIKLDSSGMTNTGNGAGVAVRDNQTLNMYDVTLNGGTASGTNGGALYISGNGVVNAVDCIIDAKGAVNGGAIYMENTASLTLANTNVTGAPATLGGAVYVAGGTAALTGSEITGAEVTNGGAVYVANGTLNLTETIVNGAAATNGGAVYMAGGTLNLTDSTVNGAPAALGGAIYLGGSTASVTMEGGLIKGANVTTGGCAVNIADAGGSFTMRSSAKSEPVIDASGCTTVQYAGAVHLSGYMSQIANSFTMDSGEIIGCESDARFGGGSVFVQGANATFTMNGGTITGAKITNATRGGGGNVHVAASGKFYMNGGTITGGETDNGLGGGVYVASGTTFRIGGNAKITENKDNDLYLVSGATVTIADDWAGNGNSAMVVEMADGIGKFGVAAEGDTLTETHKAGFSHALGYKVVLENNSLSLDTPYHCICGANEGEKHFDDCNQEKLLWRPWYSTNSLPTEAGNWYLVDDVATGQWGFYNSTHAGKVVNLDLNGHSITYTTGNRAIFVHKDFTDDFTLNITDSSAEHKGTITTSGNSSAEGAMIWMRPLDNDVNVYLNIYRITLDASQMTTTNFRACVAVEKNHTLNMYGVTLNGGTATGNNGGALYMASNGVVKAVDCTIGAVGAVNGGAVYMAGGTLNLTGSTVNGVAATTNGGAIYVAGGTAALTNSEVNGAAATSGGAVYVAGGTLNMTDSIIEGAAATDGGAVYVAGGTAALTGSEITGAEVTNGGAVYVANGTLNLTETIVNGAAAEKGGAVYMANGAVNLTETTVDGVAVTADGGAVYVAGGTLDMTESTINGAKAGAGGALAIYGGTVNMYGGEIVASDVNSLGGAVHVQNTSASFTMDKSNKGEEPKINALGKTAKNFGAAVSVNNGAFTMECGTIVGGTTNHGTYGGGAVFVQGDKSSFIMNGGTITGGKASSGKGGGVSIHACSIFQIGGDAQILDNTDNDLYLHTGAVITIADGWEGNVGLPMVVVMEDTLGTFATAAQGAEYTGRFANPSKYSVNFNSETNTLYLDAIKHCICGANGDEEHFDDCNRVLLPWEPWDKTDSLPTEAGNYYLTDNVQLTALYCPTVSGINLDLNGKNITAKANTRAIMLANSYTTDITLTITDSSTGDKGAIIGSGSSDQGALLWLRDPNEGCKGGKLNIYRATLDASGLTSTKYGVGASVEDATTLNMYGVTLKGGTATGNGGALIIMGTGAVKAVDCTISAVKAYNGGAIYMQDTASLTLTDTTVNGASATLGGAVYVAGGTLNMTDSTLKGADINNGGAMALYGGTVNMYGGKIVAGNVSSAGGAIHIEGTSASFTMSASDKGEPEINASGKTAAKFAAAVNVNKGKFTMNCGTIIGGTANGAGAGAVLVQGGATFTMNGGTITGGTAASGKGGGVYLTSGITFQIGGDAKITGNTDNDLYLESGATITIAGDWAGNGESAMVVKTADAVTESGPTIANAASGVTLTAQQAANFTTLDNYEAHVNGDGSSIYLGYPTYCVCGANEGEDHIGCDGTILTWQPWTSTTSLPTEGNYYLTGDVTTGQWYLHGVTKYTDSSTASATINLDLNGKKITVTSNQRALYWHSKLTAKITLNITDASAGHEGSITTSGSLADWGSLIYMRNPDTGYQGGELNIYRIKLDSSGMTNTKNGGAGVVVRNNQTLNMYGVTLNGGTASGTNGGALYISGNGSVTLENCTVTGGTVTGDGSTTGLGGAIYMQDTASLTLTDSTINGSSAVRGGAVAVYGGSVTMNGGKIVAGNVSNSGGAVQMKGASTASFTMSASAKGDPVIDASGKTAERYASAVNVDGYAASTTFTMNCGTIIGGTGNSTGAGAVAVQDGSTAGGKGFFIMNGGKITGGTAGEAAAYGGGNVTVFAGGVFRMNGGLITGGKDLSTFNAGGIMVAEGATEVTIGGTANVYGNTGCDIYLVANEYITIANGWRGNGTDDEQNKYTMSIVYKGTELKVVARDTAITDDASWNDQANDWLTYLTDGVGLVVDTDGIYTTKIDESLLRYHCICGANEGEAHIGDCNEEVLTWRPWYSANTLPTTAGNYYLEKDITTGQWGFYDVPNAGTVVNMDLNGHTVTSTSGDRAIFVHNNFTDDFTLNITDSSADHNGTIVRSGSKAVDGALIWMRELKNDVDVTMNIYRITLNASGITNTGKGAGVTVDKNHSLNMYDVTLNGGTASGNNGGALYISGSATLENCTVNGGTADKGGAIYTEGSLSLKNTTVSGGKSDMGGAVYVNGGTFTLGGKVVISGENLNDTAANNVYLAPGSYITLSEALTEGSSIGVTVHTMEGAVMEGRFTNWDNAEANKAYFSGDNGAEIGVNEGHGLYLKGAQTYRVGYGEASINPDVNMLSTLKLSGYGSKLTPTTIDGTYGLKAQCVAVTDPQGDTVLMINTDLNYIETWNLDARARISAATGVPVDNIVISADHVHSAPYVEIEGGTTPVELSDGTTKSYMDIVKEGLVEAAAEAMAGRGVISKVEQAVHEGVNDNANGYLFSGIRNYKAYKANRWTGSVSSYLGIYTSNHQSFASLSTEDKIVYKVKYVAESEVDDELQLVKYTYNLNGVEKTLILANFQTHPHLGSGNDSTMITSDVVGAFRQSLSASTGADVIYFSGAGGNVDPVSKEDDANNFETTEFADYGAALANIAFDTLNGNNVTVKSGDAMNKDVEVETTIFTATPYVDTDFGEVPLGDVNTAGTRLYRAQQIYNAYVANPAGYSHAESDSLNYGIYSQFHAEWMLKRAGGTGTSSMSLGAYAVGDIGFVSAPYEMYDTNGQEIKNKVRYGVVASSGGEGYEYATTGAEALTQNGFDMTFVVTQANGSKTYIPSALGYANGGYAVDIARVAEGTGEDLVDEFLRMLNLLRPAN